MPAAAQKSVRFARVVERAGQPHAHTLWTAPEKDAEFTRALRANRVMTVLPGGSGKADVGRIGFSPKDQGQLLIFPKSLKAFEGDRIIGIKFDLVAQPKTVVVSAPKRKAAAPPARPARHTTASSKPAAANQRSKRKSSADAAAVEQDEDKPAAASAPSEPAPAAQATARPARAAPPAARSEPQSEDSSSPAPLVREVRAAMKELESGKAVAAYQRLERALAAEQT